jgi:hypothetical protein
MAERRHEIHINIDRRATAVIKLELQRARHVERRQIEREGQTANDERRQQHREYMRRRRAAAASLV